MPWVPSMKRQESNFLFICSFSNLFKKKEQSMRLNLSFIDLDNSILEKIK